MLLFITFQENRFWNIFFHLKFVFILIQLITETQKPPLPDTGLKPLKRRDVFVDGAFYKDCVIFTVFDYSLCLLCFKSYVIRNMLVKLSRLHAEGNLRFHIFSQTSATYLNNSNVTAKKKKSFLFRISSVNVTKLAENFGFGHIYKRNF